MATITLLDDSTRPRAPKLPGVSPEQRARGQHLAMIHRMHLAELDRTRNLLGRIEAGQQSAEAFGPALAAMPMTRNYQSFGNLCGRDCEMLNAHHGIEDDYVFAPLRAKASEGLVQVIDRLSAEHRIIHQQLEDVEALAVAIIEKPGTDTFAALKDAFLVLERLVRSHFGYEETELEEALGYYEIGV